MEPEVCVPSGRHPNARVRRTRRSPWKARGRRDEPGEGRAQEDSDTERAEGGTTRFLRVAEWPAGSGEGGECT